jgi:hypothetical protein
VAAAGFDLASQQGVVTRESCGHRIAVGFPTLRASLYVRK